MINDPQTKHEGSTCSNNFCLETPSPFLLTKDEVCAQELTAKPLHCQRLCYDEVSLFEPLCVSSSLSLTGVQSQVR